MSVTLPAPIKVNATDDNTNKYLYVIGTIAAYGGIDIDVNEVATRFPNFVDEVMALADEIYTEYADTYGWTNDTQSGHTGSGSHRDGSDGIIQSADDIQGYLDYLVSALKPYNPVSDFVDYRFLFCLVRAVARWCDSHIHTYELPEGSTLGNVATVSGYVDFYTQGSFSFTFPLLSNNVTNQTVVFPLNNCDVSYVFNYTYYLQKLWLQGVTTGSNSVRSGYYLVKIAPHNYDFSFVLSVEGGASSTSEKTFTFCSSNFTSLANLHAYLLSFDGSSRVYRYILRDSGYFASGDKRYKLSSVTGGYAFVNRYDDTDIYNNLVFESCFDALVWFWDLCGINIRQGSPSMYTAVDNSDSPIIIDNTKYEQTITNITNTVTNETYQEGDSVEMVFPSYYITNNYYNYDDYRQHPEYILDFNQDGLLNSDFNMPAYDGNILATKFPFCIPFDCYNLVSNLVATPEAPEFHWLVLPANSFGMSNEDFYIDLDFTPYNFLVQLMRFFIAAGFVVWLMTKTKDLMQ